MDSSSLLLKEGVDAIFKILHQDYLGNRLIETPDLPPRLPARRTR